ncbi:hypothetical protein [Streptomyces sp. NPDC046870]|uniref:hypothetical protein n=1 Tax=Streptomyces sp. NPDC046870 TaxID=3155135 RepID=UPI0034540072
MLVADVVDGLDDVCVSEVTLQQLAARRALAIQFPGERYAPEVTVGHVDERLSGPQA